MIDASIGTQSEYVIPDPTAHTSESTCPANNANFKGHQLQATQSSRRVETALQGNCALCLQTFTSTEIKPLSLLPCFHVYHSECTNKLLNYQQPCPECKGVVSPSTIKVYDNSTLLRESLPLECTENLCTAVGTNASISSGTKALCPYPLVTFPHQEAKDFLKNNHTQIIAWLIESFAQKQYTIADVFYDEKCCYTDEFIQLHPQPMIIISVKFNPNGPKIDLGYTSADIDNATTPEAAFTNLLEDIRTDLLFLSLKNTYPAIFDQKTDLCIFHYDLWKQNAIFINDLNNSIPLRNVFDPSTKFFSWNRLKLELKEKNLEYKKLFDTTPSEKLFESRPVDSFDGFYSNSRSETIDLECYSSSQRPVSDSTLDIPSGQFDTDRFLF
ncbi:RING finger domain-containing protein [Endozoicomonas acroporae]|uniref:RING finger domain-containing protein n=1 Tax=Endozoicomonas acroporae TaxID=1701104 RepID=UPI0011AECDDC|nr:RING finger domain-containing protein [Endozoicomonas acroporae]